MRPIQSLLTGDAPCFSSSEEMTANELSGGDEDDDEVKEEEELLFMVVVVVAFALAGLLRCWFLEETLPPPRLSASAEASHRHSSGAPMISIPSSGEPVEPESRRMGDG